MLSVEEQLEELRPLIRIIVRERVGSQTWLLDDAEQEAMIAAWTRLSEGHSPGIAIHKAKQAVIDVVRSRRATGSKRPGGIVDTHTKSESIFKATPDGEEYAYEPADDAAERAMDALEARDALRGALRALPAVDREILHGLFFEDLTQAEVARRHGVTRQAISLRLRKACQTLRPLVAA